ncbi:MAG: hypothetical protein ACTHMM_13140 [Agriterribacter sp.]
MNFNSKDILLGDWLTVAGQPENSDEEVSVNGIVIIKKGAAVTGKIVNVVPSTGRRRALI